jgi:ribulose 1,5-bisphosphate synthetase/thiazole synthase
LKKKYGAAPVKQLRYDPNAKPDANADAKPQPDSTTKPSSTNSRTSKQQQKQPAKANLDLASVEQLTAELTKRTGKVLKFDEVEKEEDDRVNEDDDDDEDDESEDGRDHFTMWTPNAEGFAERAVIVGGGPAGLSAAIYAARAGLRPVVIAPPSGGQLQGKGVLVENYPAVLGATGPHVVYEMMKQAAKFGTRFVDELVAKVDLSVRPFEIHLNDTIVKTHSLILATGADSRWLGVEGEYEYRGGGVSSCATCDGFLYKDRDVVVVGGGDAAMDDALHLARTSSSVTLIHRRDKFRASHILAQRVLNNPKVRTFGFDLCFFTV